MATYEDISVTTYTITATTGVNGSNTSSGSVSWWRAEARLLPSPPTRATRSAMCWLTVTPWAQSPATSVMHPCFQGARYVTRPDFTAVRIWQSHHWLDAAAMNQCSYSTGVSYPKAEWGYKALCSAIHLPSAPLQLAERRPVPRPDQILPDGSDDALRVGVPLGVAIAAEDLAKAKSLGRLHVGFRGGLGSMVADQIQPVRLSP